MNVRVCHLVRDRRGAAAVELAIIAPVLALLFGCVADFGLFLWTKERTAAAVAEGMQYAFTTGATLTTAQVQGFVQQSASVALGGFNWSSQHLEGGRWRVGGVRIGFCGRS